ncbi:MAG: hypothetical protein COB67_13295 [SAR324 cluster bacterium]|uniref:PepSY domain-containing protein n=1 Tax=SAR324 cluster bacterium TaxID=2024889 RepID=A0A2A4SNE8_9DELT|nr:MAG: hypothetical protein COB67_13295 [SAR324 cluster bacterium]
MSQSKSVNWKKWNRKIHYWGSLVIALPVLIVLLSGIVLQVKKQVSWVQPKTMRGEGKVPKLSFEKILKVAKTVPEAKIKKWKHIKKLDVRPKKGIIKILAKNKWEIQIDHQSGKVLQVEYRRSDLIEGLHDGSFFHEQAKLWLFLPSAVILLIIWITGIYLFLIPFMTKRNKKRRAEAAVFP